MVEFCSLSSGSSGNTNFLKAGNTTILVEAGNTLKYIISAMEQIGQNPADISAVFVTHEHSDHMGSAGALHRKFGCDIFMNENTYAAGKSKLGKLNEKKIHLFKSGDSFDYKDIGVNTIGVNHDSADNVSYAFHYKNSKISTLTDLGEVNLEIAKHVSGSDIIMLEANHDEELLKMGDYPYSLKKRVLAPYGHLSNYDSAKFLIDVMKISPISQVLLAHLSGDNNLPELAYETFRCMLLENNIRIGREIMVDLTYRNKLSKLYRINK